MLQCLFQLFRRGGTIMAAQFHTGFLQKKTEDLPHSPKAYHENSHCVFPFLI
jgi:hypothetical protein